MTQRPSRMIARARRIWSFSTVSRLPSALSAFRFLAARVSGFLIFLILGLIRGISSTRTTSPDTLRLNTTLFNSPPPALAGATAI